MVAALIKRGGPLFVPWQVEVARWAVTEPFTVGSGSIFPDVWTAGAGSAGRISSSAWRVTTSALVVVRRSFRTPLLVV